MSIGIVDTTVVLHYFRKMPQARYWVDNQTTRLSVTRVTWLEVMEGATNKVNQAACKTILSMFDLITVTSFDQRRAMTQLEQFQFSHHIGMNDCLIAAVAHRLQVPLYTHNLKDMLPMVGNLAIKPY